MCNAHNVEILIDGQTYEKTKDDFVFKEIGEKLLLGFIKPVMLYSPEIAAVKKEI
jgi:class 3 adenylate cyclase